MIRIRNFKLEKREEVNPFTQFMAAIIALAAALLLSGFLVNIAGGNAIDAFVSLFQGGFGDKSSFLETLVKSTPILLTGLAATIAFRAQLWNIGGEGQLFAGAMAAYLAYVGLVGMWPPLHMLIIVLAGCVGGALWALLAAALKAYFRVDEIISTVMLNYIVTYLLSLLLSGVWKEAGSVYRQSPQIGTAVRLPIILTGSRLSIAFPLAVLAAFLIWYILQKTPLGYEIRAIGDNPIASRFKGISVTRTWIVTMLISGALAGLAGATELFGVQHRLRLDLSTGYGFTGIIVAMLGGLNPLMVIISSIFFGGLINGSIRMQIITKVPTALISAIQAIILLFLLGSQALVLFRIRRVGDG